MSLAPRCWSVPRLAVKDAIFSSPTTWCCLISPLNPDLLEQRIGRLDRIGQAETIHIHVPYFVGTAQEVMFRWYQEGIGLFERSVGAAYTLLSILKPACENSWHRRGRG